MLKILKQRRINGSGLRTVIVYSRYNAEYVDGMRRGAHKVLKKAGADFEEFEVPGAFEIPVVAAAIARRTHLRPDAIICLGLILQGETSHASHIGSAVTSALMALQVESGIPCVHEVLVVQSHEQARARTLNPRTNRGAEAAATALKMGILLRSLKTQKSPQK